MSSNLLNIGLSGLNAAQWGLTTTGQNISNASTPGYSVERPVYQETGGQYTGSGYLPQGVSTSTVQRQYSQYLTTQLNNAQSQGGSLNTYYTLIAQLNNLVGSPTTGIASAITGYFTGLQGVSNNPADQSARQTAISSAQTLANQINAAGQQYDQLRASVNTQLSSTVQSINSYTAQIAQLNAQIAAGSSAGQPPNQLLDQRDLAVSNLSQLVGVQVVQNGNSYSLFMSSGQPLVLADKSFNLGTATSPGDPTEQSVTYLGLAGATPAPTPQTMPDSSVSGGTLGGLLTFRSQTLDPAAAQLGAIATSFAAQVNAQNALGIDLSGKAGGNLFTVGSPTVYANQNNTSSATLSASFANAAQPTTSDYTLSYDGTKYTLTDNETGTTTTAANLTNPIGGLQFSLSGTMAAGDSFTVQPTRGALDNFALATTNAGAIAAASPVLAAKGSSNSGAATISQGSVGAGYSLPTGTTTLTYSSAPAPATGGFLTGFPAGSIVNIPGSAPVTIVDGTTQVPYNPATGATLTINSATTPAPAGSMNAVTVTLSGTPNSGDTFTIGQNTGGSNDGRNALALSNLVTAKALNGGTSTLTSAYANYVNTIGNQTNQVQSQNKAQTSLVTQITSAQQSVSGVNINEEAANLLQYQQLYQANSKVIQTASTLFQTLLGIFQ
ncbi:MULTISPECIES: flagellar hook-associated protein FlgK [Paraburkholderia]|uniref:flagellar hook-associated protein FlgK n=1 Tax=Paraburkholderia TaxID=1822464 RepID=UPI002251077B|nr:MULTISPECIES: flagellar hook-associated protein FlgK [Paraburkholderia]MCX4164777.1 flagellar hook-associated protein FlgK [Paraburkholderia megapolitana]MDN7160270.1 flagellar hook-associated protein FlgK [Paraburkholderia sp. CHISQ3]MDQ6497317.1 flagellar hook-associated protein FlgK [Paraburkholderia megapolitana]